MRLHITVSDKDDAGKHTVYVDAFAVIGMNQEDAAVWATNCLYQAARYAASSDDENNNDDEIEVVDAAGNPTSRAKPLMRDVYIVSVPEDATATIELLVKAAQFSTTQALEGIQICQSSGLRLKVAEGIPPDIALLLMEDLEKSGCKVEMI